VRRRNVEEARERAGEGDDEERPELLRVCLGVAPFEYSELAHASSLRTATAQIM